MVQCASLSISADFATYNELYTRGLIFIYKGSRADGPSRCAEIPSVSAKTFIFHIMFVEHIETIYFIKIIKED